MNDLIIDLDPKTPEQLASLRQITLVVYVLYESHFTWQIRTFWWVLLWCVVGGSTFWFGIGFLVLAAAGIWYLYRLVKGFLNWSDKKTMEV